jgi:hypothetical protein
MKCISSAGIAYKIVMVTNFVNCVCALGIFSTCHEQNECDADKCCAKAHHSKIGFCMATKQLGDQCSPTYLFGRGMSCGCKKGLTCALIERSPLLHLEKHRCVQIPKEPLEKDTTKLNNSTTLLPSKKLKFITAKELSTLLKLLRRQPKIKWTK